VEAGAVQNVAPSAMFAAGIDYETRDGRVVLKEGGVLDAGTTLQVRVV